MNYTRMIRDSRAAKKAWVEDVDNAMANAEQLAPDDGSTIQIVQKGHTQHNVEEGDSRNWHYAIHDYHVWGWGNVKKGKGRSRCCYYMRWTSHLRDNYEFTNAGIPVGGGLVYDSWMWKLNKYGIARHFKIRGSKHLNLTWTKGFRFILSDWENLNRGIVPIFPQCQLGY